ncbi:MAG: TlpA family protein disulfide reductase [Armatimonadota bacterium]
MKNQGIRHSTRAENGHPDSSNSRMTRQKMWAVAPALAGVMLVGVVVFLAVRPTVLPSPSPGNAAVPAVGLAVGNLAPDFHLTDVFGKLVSRSSLVADRPGLLFFTTTYCAPCVEGLRALTRLQHDVGADRFSVLVAFVDPGEPPAALRAYQQEHGLPQTWFYALDTDEMVSKYRLRALDTKYVLDRAGVIHFTDVYPASYDTWRQALALVGVTPK